MIATNIKKKKHFPYPESVLLLFLTGAADDTLIELAVVQMGVVTAFSQQLFMRALLDYAAICHDKYMVSIFYRR